MIRLGHIRKYHVVCGYTDLRKGIDGLAAIVMLDYEMELDHESAYLFCGRRADRIKVLFWSGSSYVTLYERLPEGRYYWPRRPPGIRTMDYETFQAEIARQTPGEEGTTFRVPPYQLF